MKKILTKERCITLIALVITIIVLLILAGVSIAMLTGDNGILTQATESKKANIKGTEEEQIKLAMQSLKMKKQADNVSTIVSSEELQNQLIADGAKNVTVEDGENDSLVVKYQESKNQYTVSQNGKIGQTENLSPEEANKIVDIIATNLNDKTLLGVTAGGEVIYIKTELVEGQIETLNTENRISISKNGVKKAGENYFLDNAGKLYTWGNNEYGQVGDGTTENRTIPVCISDMENDLKGKSIKEIEFPGYEVVALDNEGNLYTWGNYYSGGLGSETTEDRKFPKCISNLENALKGKIIKKIDEQAGTIIALDNEGKIFTWGNNECGQLGYGGMGGESQSIPKCISNLENALKGKQIIDVCIEAEAVIALDNEGKIYTWGSNSLGQLGKGNTFGDNVAIECISNLENKLKGKKIKKIYKFYQTPIVIDDIGKMYAWGGFCRSALPIPICISDMESDLKGKKIEKIYTEGGNSLFIIDNEGKVYTMGENHEGQLGDGTRDDRNIPKCISDLENDLKGKIIKEIYLFDTCVVAIDQSNKFYLWGGVAEGLTTEETYSPRCLTDDENSKLYNKNINKIYYNSGWERTGAILYYKAYITNEGEIIYYFYRIER